jgi:selenocysteine-specific translation elongation factor
MPGTQALCQKFLKVLKGQNALLISAVTGEGLNELKMQLFQMLDRHHG